MQLTHTLIQAALWIFLEGNRIAGPRLNGRMDCDTENQCTAPTENKERVAGERSVNFTNRHKENDLKDIASAYRLL